MGVALDIKRKNHRFLALSNAFFTAQHPTRSKSTSFDDFQKMETLFLFLFSHSSGETQRKKEKAFMLLLR